MKFPRRALCVFLLLICAAHAQKDDDTPLGDFAPLDDDLVLYIPKFNVRLGFRGLSGAKTSFKSTGFLSSSHTLGSPTGLLDRYYHDGSVLLDTRTALDPAGTAVPIEPDGRTNTWGFLSETQIQTSNELTGLIAFHAYEATVTDTSARSKDGPMTFGVELSLEREMGSLANGRLKWGVIVGLSLNQLAVESQSDHAASVLTTTDYFSLNGQGAPVAGYNGPQFFNGVDTTVLLGSEPLGRVFTTTATTTAFSSHTKIRGAYMTLRAGPTLFLPISNRFSASFSAGLALAFVGTTMDVQQAFKPETGDDITEAMDNETSRLLPGFYVDANMQFAMNDFAGLYVGGVYQNSGSFTQETSSPDGRSNYVTRVDLSSLQGIRAGVSFKF